MTAKSLLRGHEAWYDEESRTWTLCANGRLVEDSDKLRCATCDRMPTPDGHDPCIANLPGVLAACCGHGKEPGYVLFEGGVVLDGKFRHVAPREDD